MVETLVSRGHSLQAVLSEYPISTVTALSKAAQINRIYDMMAAANGAAVGAIHAIEAGFSGKQPRALRSHIDNLQRQIKSIKSSGQGSQEDAKALLAGFTGTAVMEKSNGRRKNRPSGSS